ncbi:uncharacterized protein LOC125261504 [Megalobrama amblycephala]|uniref:uncharacterized protein LOC125261504 n=1 Tax=Megalobrama amblycephala TaxID=75352 RepID=UPI002013C7FB|nr:uncharacterized protein LOC125261504 [Megalobrama amblycephala]
MKLLFWLLVFLFFSDRGVSGLYSVRVPVSVNEGDSVTLNTGVQTNLQEDIKWYFNGILIAQISGDLSYSCTDVQCNEGTERFRDRLKLDHQTGSLTIMNTRNTDSGEYKLLLISRTTSETIFNVTVSGVSAAEHYKMKTISGIRGEYVILDPDEGLNDAMMWYFNDTIIANITGDASKICTDVQCEHGDGRFRDRLIVDHQTGSLTITNIRTTDSGLYRLQIIYNSNSFSISRMKSFSVSVIGLSTGEIAGISAAAGAVLLVAAAGVIYCKRKNKKRNSDKQELDHDETKSLTATNSRNDPEVQPSSNEEMHLDDLNEQCNKNTKRNRDKPKLDHGTETVIITSKLNYKLQFNKSSSSTTTETELQCY